MSNWAETLLTAIPVAALVSAGVTLWLRGRDRPQAHWVGETLEVSLPRFPTTAIQAAISGEPPHAAITVANAGDIDAFALRLEGVGCDPYFVVLDKTDPRGGRLTQSIVRAPSGVELNIIIRPLSGTPFDLQKAIVRLIWLRSPVRHRQYEAQEFDVAHPERPPLPQPWKPPFQG